MFGWAFYANPDNRWQFDSYDGTTGPGNTIVGPAVEPGQWTHVVGMYDVTDMNFYVNGSPAGTLANAFYDADVLVPLWIGAGTTQDGSGPGGELWVGQVDEVARYDHAIVQDQYAASFGVATSPEINLDPQFTWVLAGEHGSLRVGARGLPLLTYQ